MISFFGDSLIQLVLHQPPGKLFITLVSLPFLQAPVEAFPYQFQLILVVLHIMLVEIPNHHILL
ncbi:hypothetical protein BLX04_01135 [Bacillus mycoides]|nr:hypothetical protein BLX04_01135 [Bacillus mycoides]